MKKLIYFKHTNKIKTPNIKYFNFWTTQKAEDIWFTKFINQHKLLDNCRKKVYFYSVLGSVDRLPHRKKGINIFYSGENIQADRFSEYKHLCEEKTFDLSLGFDFGVGDDYLRFPLWILSLFDPMLDYEGVKMRVKQLSKVQRDNRKGFCSLVASHDWNGIRGEIIDALSEIGTISSGGKFRNNTDELNTRYANNKHDFIRQFKFNICPENSNAEGYVTEKLFQAIAAGCIPIYWGSNNQPELDILNQNAILFWNQGGDNSLNIQLIRELHLDSEFYKHFMEQPRLSPNAEDKIWEYYMDLKQRFTELFR